MCWVQGMQLAGPPGGRARVPEGWRERERQAVTEVGQAGGPGTGGLDPEATGNQGRVYPGGSDLGRKYSGS